MGWGRGGGQEEKEREKEEGKRGGGGGGWELEGLPLRALSRTSFD